MISFCCKPKNLGKECGQISQKYSLIVRRKGKVPADITVCSRYDSDLNTMRKTGFITHNF